MLCSDGFPQRIRTVKGIFMILLLSLLTTHHTNESQRFFSRSVSLLSPLCMSFLNFACLTIFHSALQLRKFILLDSRRLCDLRHFFFCDFSTFNVLFLITHNHKREEEFIFLIIARCLKGKMDVTAYAHSFECVCVCLLPKYLMNQTRF